MSYSGEIEAAGAAALVKIAARAVGHAAAAGIRAVQSAVHTKAVAGMQSRLASLTERARAADAALGSELEAAAAQCYADYAKTLTALQAACEQTSDVPAFLRDCAAARERLYGSIGEKRSGLEAGAIAAVRDAMRSGQALLRRERQETESSVQRIADNMQRKEYAGETARRVIAETAAMTEDLRLAYGTSAAGAQAVQACAALLHRAEILIGQGLCEAALTSAYAAQDAVLLHVTELMTAECRNRQLYADAVTALETAQSLLSERQGSVHFENTRSGIPVDREIADLPHYFRGAWESLEQELSGCAAILKGVHPCDHDPLVLEDVLRQLVDWQNQFAREYALAYERIGNELLRQETGRLLVGNYRALGYQLLPLTAEERAVSPLDSLLVRLGRPDTGEVLELRLNAVPDADGHITMRILTEDHTNYPGSDAEIEAARNAAREKTCDTIRNSGIGQGLYLRQRCTNPGVRDACQKP